MNTEKLTDKIKHMLAIAHDPSASEAEREQAMNKAHALMLKHGIEVAHDDHANSSVFGHRDMIVRGVYSESMANMLYFIALSYKSFDMVLTSIPRTSTINLTIAGPDSQLDEVYRVFESILEQSTTERKRWASEALRGMNRSYQKKQINSFYLGYGARVADRIEAILAAEASQADRQALVLVKDKATDHLGQIFGELAQKGSGRRTISGSAFAVGSMAGDRAQLNNQLS